MYRLNSMVLRLKKLDGFILYSPSFPRASHSLAYSLTACRSDSTGTPSARRRAMLLSALEVLACAERTSRTYWSATLQARFLCSAETRHRRRLGTIGSPKRSWLSFGVPFPSPAPPPPEDERGVIFSLSL
jgi:hypothetical protein